MNSRYGLPFDCRECHLRSENFFCALSVESLGAFNRIRQSSVLPDVAVLFVEGQDSRGVFMLCEGEVKLSTTSVEGKTLILRIARAGELLGLDSVITGTPYHLTAETMQPCRLSFVETKD